MGEVSHWDCWGWCGMKTVSRPEPNSTPEAAMDLLLRRRASCPRRPPANAHPRRPRSLASEGPWHSLLQGVGWGRTLSERHPRRTRTTPPSPGTAAPPVVPQPMDFAWGAVEETVACCRSTFTVAIDELANESTTWTTSVTPPTGPAR